MAKKEQTLANTRIEEYRLTAALTRGLQAIADVWFFKVKGGGGQRAGMPDIVGLVRGRFFCIEVKSSLGSLSSLQVYELRKVMDCGGMYFGVCDKASLEAVLMILRDYDGGLTTSNLQRPDSIHPVRMKKILRRVKIEDQEVHSL